MRLFGKVDTAINQYDRAEWLTPPFVLMPELGPLAQHVISGVFGVRLALAAVTGHEGMALADAVRVGRQEMPRLALAAVTGHEGMALADAVRVGRQEMPRLALAAVTGHEGMALADAVRAGRANTREP